MRRLRAARGLRVLVNSILGFLTAPAFVGGLPFDEERPIVEVQACGLLRDVDVDRRAGEDGGHDEGELAGEHKPSL